MEVSDKILKKRESDRIHQQTYYYKKSDEIIRHKTLFQARKFGRIVSKTIQQKYNIDDKDLCFAWMSFLQSNPDSKAAKRVEKIMESQEPLS